ncbi:DUF4365 domain-containing protein [Bacillus sp. FJAT-29937]|uniref:DUF4365 domain-containing protein n=1 Tax=Bacillus sp. FJAT-29937 TaxID=1720553 RepID=UPI000836C08F|nr:DUF4365 domain-containing protein [Bacillus sp. FJAT-29937]
MYQNWQLERLAVNEVKKEALKPFSNLLADIPEGDKAISFDGEIQVLQSNTATVESLIGKVPVQVKGTGVNKFTNRPWSYSLELKHYENYYSNSGVLLLVGEVLESGETQLYYKQLLPNELRKIIKLCKEKKQKSRIVIVRPLSESTLYKICKDFHDERIKILESIKAFTPSDFDALEVSSLTYNPLKEETGNIFEHEFNIYGVKDKLKIPLDTIRISALSAQIEETYNINNNKYILNTKVTEGVIKNELIIENSLYFGIHLKKNKLDFKFKRFHSLAAQLKVIPFFIDFVTAKGISTIDWEMELGEDWVKFQGFIEGLKENYINLQKLKGIFEQMKISLDRPLQPEQTESGYEEVMKKACKFVDVFYYHNYDGIGLEKLNGVGFVNYGIGELDILLLYVPKVDNKLLNAFSEEVAMKDIAIASDEGATRYPHSIYILLTKSALAHSANLNIDIIKESFDKIKPFENEVVSQFTNQFCLKCLSAFDLCGNYELLSLVEYIYEKYDSSKIPNYQQIVTINVMQARIRKLGKLTQEDYATLLQLRAVHITNYEVQFCISVLLQSKIEAEIYFSKFEPYIKKYYEGLPIIKIYNDLLEN